MASTPITPPSAPPFGWAQARCGLVLRCPPLSAASDHLFTTRGCSVGGATADAAWRVVAETVGLRPDRLVRIRQVHGSTVLTLRRSRPLENVPGGLAEGDAMVTDDPTIALGIRVADCVPIVLSDPRTRTVGIAHAGWRGTAAGVAREVVRAMRDDFGVRPDEVIAAIGPSIGPCCYEVGEGVRAAFASAGYRTEVERWFKTHPGVRLHLDLWRANREQLVSAGLLDGRIHTAALCTATRLDLFYSHRRERTGAGRLAAVVRVRAADRVG